MCLLDICPSTSHWLSLSLGPLCIAVFFFTACETHTPTHTHSVNVEKSHKEALNVCAVGFFFQRKSEFCCKGNLRISFDAQRLEVSLLLCTYLIAKAAEQLHLTYFYT